MTVYRLVASGTIEQKIVALHESKRDLADRLLEGTDKVSKLDADELAALLTGTKGPSNNNLSNWGGDPSPLTASILA